jgi:hypothetical protein
MLNSEADYESMYVYFWNILKCRDTRIIQKNKNKNYNDLPKATEGTRQTSVAGMPHTNQG